jgi:SAM-dependent MidA family methyltransferase
VERAGQLGAAEDAATRRAIEAAVARLAGEGAGEMGALFKVLGVTARQEPVPGFHVVAGARGW